MESHPTRKRILVVDEESAIRLLLKEALGANYQVETAGDGGEGFVKFLEFQPHLVLTDLAMPGRDGIELINSIRETGSKIPVIAVSGHPWGNPIMAAARMVGANLTLQKPFTMPSVQTAVGALLSGQMEMLSAQSPRQ